MQKPNFKELVDRWPSAWVRVKKSALSPAGSFRKSTRPIWIQGAWVARGESGLAEKSLIL